MRPIDADALEKELNNERERFVALDMKGAEHILVHSALRLLREAPTIDAVPQWIPCEERLPEEYDEYLCCDKDGEYYVNYLEDADWAREFTKNESIVAWMPLPEVYVGERRDDE